MRLDQINIRDPYILQHDGSYYLYGTRSETCWGEASGFDCYVSPDRENWEGPIEIFRRPEGFFATHSYWAPECYAYRGSFYLLTTFGGDGIKKGIYLLRSDSPEGPFELFTDRLTPAEWAGIDGTLYFGEDKVFLIYSRSFEDVPDADICMQELSEDLKKTVSGPKTLFKAREASWARPVPFAREEFGIEGDVYFSDGPCVFSLEDGSLCMTWSSWSRGSYAVGAAVSESGSAAGPWKQQEIPLWPENGGHGMVFEDRDGGKYFVFHYPNDKTLERPCIRKLMLQDGLLKLV